MTGKNLKYYLLTSASMVALTFITYFFGGFLQLFAGILISVLIGAQTSKFHYGFVAASSSLVFLIALLIPVLSAVTFSSAVLYAILLIIPIILMGLTLGFAANLKIDFYKTVVILSVLYLAGTLTSIKVLDSFGASAMNIESIISQSIDRVFATLETAYENSPEIKEVFSLAIGTISSMMLTLAPAIFIIISLAVGYMTAIIFKAFLKRRQVDMSFWPPFYMQRSDKSTAIIFIIIFFLNSFAPSGWFSDVTANVIVILSCIFFMNGLAFLSWKMRASGIKAHARRLMLVALVPLCSMMFMLPFLILTITGVLDGMLDYRNRLKNNQNKE